jgi:hypothetical protein
LEQLAQFRLSSYRRFVKGERPEFMVCDDWLAAIGGIADTTEGWQRYHEYLAWLAADEGEQKRQGFETMSRGWAIGDDPWRKALAKENAESLAAQEPRGEEMGELKEAVWSRELDRLLEKAGKTRGDAGDDWCGAEWKVEIAVELRRRTTATNDWIAREVSMGTSGSSVSVLVSRWRKAKSKK